MVFFIAAAIPVTLAYIPFSGPGWSRVASIARFLPVGILLDRDRGIICKDDMAEPRCDDTRRVSGGPFVGFAGTPWAGGFSLPAETR